MTPAVSAGLSGDGRELRRALTRTAGDEGAAVVTYRVFYAGPSATYQRAPDIQYVRNPARQPDQSSIWTQGVRAILTL